MTDFDFRQPKILRLARYLVNEAPYKTIQVPPTLDQIAKTTGYVNKSSVHKAIKRLQDNQVIRKQNGRYVWDERFIGK